MREHLQMRCVVYVFGRRRRRRYLVGFDALCVSLSLYISLSCYTTPALTDGKTQSQSGCIAMQLFWIKANLSKNGSCEWRYASLGCMLFL